MRKAAAGLFFIVGTFALAATASLLGLTSTPQDSGVAASGEWEIALLPAGMAAASFWAGVVLWRGSGRSR